MGGRTQAWLVGLALVSLLGACTESEAPEVLACDLSEDCPESQACLQGTCVAEALPEIVLLSPEEGQPYAHGSGDHEVLLSIEGLDLVLRPLAESTEAVVGEGHLEIFVDEVSVGTLDSGDLAAGLSVPITIPDEAGAHRIRVQTKLNDGTIYDHQGGAVRRLVWVDDGQPHVALRRPWPGDSFGLESEMVEAEVDAIGLELGPPLSGNFNVKVYYDEVFPACFDDAPCTYGYVGVVPNNMSSFGPVVLPEAGAGSVTLTAVVSNPDHTLYDGNGDAEGGQVWSQVSILRSVD